MQVHCFYRVTTVLCSGQEGTILYRYPNGAGIKQMYNIITANNNNNKGLSGWAILWIPGFDVSVAGTGTVFHAIASARHSEPSPSLGNVIG